MRLLSPYASGTSRGTLVTNSRPFSAAREPSDARTASTVSRTEYSPRASSMRPASILERSRTSLMRRSRCRPLCCMSVSGRRSSSEISP